MQIMYNKILFILFYGIILFYGTLFGNDYKKIKFNDLDNIPSFIPLYFTFEKANLIPKLKVSTFNFFKLNINSTYSTNFIMKSNNDIEYKQNSIVDKSIFNLFKFVSIEIDLNPSYYLSSMPTKTNNFFNELTEDIGIEKISYFIKSNFYLTYRISYPF